MIVISNGGSVGGGGPAVQKEVFKIEVLALADRLTVADFKKRFAAEGAFMCDIGAK